MKQFVVLLLLAALFSGCAQVQEQQNSGNAQPANFSLTVLDSENNVALEKELSAFGGTSLLEALRENSIQLETEQSSYGAFLTGIAGVKPAQGEYIAIYAGGAYAEKGVSDLIVEEGSEFEFRVEKIEGFGG